MKKRLFPDIITPNKITVFRMICVVIICFLTLFPWGKCGINFTSGVDYIYLTTLILFLVASYSDHLDGHLARKYNLVSNFGKFMDPIADKLLVNSLFIILACKGYFIVPVIFVVIMVARDIVVDVLRMLAMEQKIVLAANIWGKLKTVLQMVALSIILLANTIFFFLSGNFVEIMKWICISLSGIATFASLMSGIIYLTKNSQVFVDKKKED